MYATLYRSVSVSMAILVFEISLLTLGSSSGFNGILMLIYVVVYGVLETVYLLLVNRRIQSVQRSDS